MDEDQRFYPAEPAETFAALRAYVRRQYGIRSSDDFSMTVAFDSHASAWTSGQRVTVSVMPADGGSRVVATGAGKVRTQLANRGQLRKVYDDLFAGVSGEIRAARD